MQYEEKSLQKHKQLRGKIEISTKDALDSREKLSIYYTPGVGAVSGYIAAHPKEARDYTWLRNLVAVISDGSAVLGLGNIGPLGALPVMEGKAMIFKSFANIDAIPIVLDVHSADEIVATIQAIAPSFGGINLEDIAAPVCFEVEDKLKEKLAIPVMHDDQHGTAIVTLAALLNATRVTGKRLKESRITLVGAGAAGVAIATLLHHYAAPEIIAVDSKGIIAPSRADLNYAKKRLLQVTNPRGIQGSLADALRDADIFIGVSQGNLLTSEMVKTMSKNPIVFAMANPIPEIMPEAAKAAGARIIATGRSDFPNQINNALAFPGIFRGALDHHVRDITDQHKIAAAEAIAALVANPDENHIMPDLFDARVVPTIANVIV